METLAFRSSWKHAVLEYQIKEIDTNPDLSRSSLTNRAIDAAENVENWVSVKDDLSQLRRMDNLPVAASMQAKPDQIRAEKIKGIREQMFSDLKNAMPELQRLQTPYFMQLLWMNYLNQLKKQKMEVGNATRHTDLTGPDMVKRLVEILLLNREADQEIIQKIKTLLIEWRE